MILTTWLLAAAVNAPAAPPPDVGAYVRAQMAEQKIPGLALAVVRDGRIEIAAGFGLANVEHQVPVKPETVFQSGSTGKQPAAAAALLLADEGRLALDDPVSKYVPAPAHWKRITVRHLLTHTSGLRATLPLYRDARDSVEALRMVFAQGPVAPPGTRVVYSDLNAILLGEIVRRVSGEPLAVFATREVLQPLGLRQTLFRPAAVLRTRIAPTGVWRGHAVAGVVNDQNAVKLGGVAGHAGLFGTAADVAQFAQFMLRGGTLPPPDGRRLLRVETVQRFTTKATDFGRRSEARALGWQSVPTGERVSSAGTLFGQRSYGHTGWTGTSLWIDPDRDLFVALLTNRAYAPRARRLFTVLKEVRSRLADAAARASDAR
jgi:beta-N-acetylhexosaminidase